MTLSRGNIFPLEVCLLLAMSSPPGYLKIMFIYVDYYALLGLLHVINNEYLQLNKLQCMNVPQKTLEKYNIISFILELKAIICTVPLFIFSVKSLKLFTSWAILALFS